MDLRVVNSSNSLNTVNIQAPSQGDSNVKGQEVVHFFHRKSILKTYETVAKKSKAKTVLLAVKKSEKKSEIQAIDIFKSQDNLKGNVLPEKKHVWLLSNTQNANNLNESGNKEEFEYLSHKMYTEAPKNLGKIVTANDHSTDMDALQPVPSEKNIFRKETANTRNVPNILRSNEQKSETPVVVTSEEKGEEDTEDGKAMGNKEESDKGASNHKRKQVLNVRHELPASTDSSHYCGPLNHKNKMKSKVCNKGKLKKSLSPDLTEEKRLIDSPEIKMNKHNRRESSSIDGNLSDVFHPFENEFIPSECSYNLSEKSNEIYEDQDLSIALDKRTKDLDLFHCTSRDYALNRINSELNKADYIDCLKTNFTDISDSDEIHKLLCPVLDESFSGESFDQHDNNNNVYGSSKSADTTGSYQSFNLTTSDSADGFENIDVVSASGLDAGPDNKFDFPNVQGGKASDDVSQQQGKEKKSEAVCKGGEINEFQCPLCSLSFKTARTLSIHRAGAHEGPFIFQCETCGLLFNKKYALNRHSIDCLPYERRYTCDICNKNYKHRSSLLLHTRKVHRVYSLGKASYTCEVCSKRYKNYSAFEKHLFLHDE